MRKSVTLVELIICMILLGVIVLGAIAFHLSAERFLSSSEGKTQVLNDLTFVLQHLQTNVLLATGDITDIGIDATGITILRLRQDKDAAGNLNFTPDDYTDDRWVRYEFRPNPNHDVRFRVEGAGNWETLSSRYLFFAPVAFRFDLINGGVRVSNLIMRQDPMLPQDPNTNPEATTVDSVLNRTVYFYSYLHTWQ